eukprot:10604-Hanusia_phi.AAC.1
MSYSATDFISQHHGLDSVIIESCPARRYGHWPVRGDPAMEVTFGWTGYGRIIRGSDRRGSVA